SLIRGSLNVNSPARNPLLYSAPESPKIFVASPAPLGDKKRKNHHRRECESDIQSLHNDPFQFLCLFKPLLIIRTPTANEWMPTQKPYLFRINQIQKTHQNI